MRTWPALDVGRLAGDRADLLQAALTDFPVAAVDETAPDRWRVFFHDAAARDHAAAALAADFPECSFEPVDVDDDDWAARSQAGLRAIRAGRIVVAPPWDVPAVTSDALVVTIQPSMGFGTGHHATTRLCLVALEALALRECRVVDVGTGSGVLAIVASLLGARDVEGVDDDPDAIQAALENLELNPAARATLRVADVRDASIRPADLVLANLTGGLLCAAAPALFQLTTSGGRLILSGLLRDEEPDVLASFGACAVESRAEEEGWVCVTLRTADRR